MAKAPTTAAAFDGSGAVWFKILDLGPTFLADGTSTWPLQRSFSPFPFSLQAPLTISSHRDIHIHHPPRPSQRRLPPPHPAARHPQPIPRRHSPILHRMRADYGLGRRQWDAWAARLNSRIYHWDGAGIYSEFFFCYSLLLPCPNFCEIERE